MNKVTKNRLLPITVFSHRSNTQQNSPPSSLCIFHQVCMPSILHLVIDPIPPEWVTRSHFPRTKRARLTAAHPFAMAAFCAPFSGEKIVVFPALEYMRSLRDAGGRISDEPRFGCGGPAGKINSSDMDGEVFKICIRRSIQLAIGR